VSARTWGFKSPRRVGHPLHRELAGLWSARRGPYRVVYKIDDDSRSVFVVRWIIAPTSTGVGDGPLLDDARHVTLGYRVGQERPCPLCVVVHGSGNPRSNPSVSPVRSSERRLRAPRV
jgi:hypothetical protein